MLNQTPLLLVVDDNENNRDTLSRVLKRQDYLVETAENGWLALEMLRAKAFDLVLLDIMMPVMSGYEVLEYLKTDKVLRHVPVIVISALDEIESVVRCIELGAEDFIQKPFNRVLLKARVGASLEKKRLRDQEQAYMQMVKRELEIGRQLQLDFLPDKLPVLPGWELGAHFKPAREVAGDFYDVFKVSPNLVGLVIADVCDKGVGAALFMALIRSLVRVLAQQAITNKAEITLGLPPTLVPAEVAHVLQTITAVNDYIVTNHSRANMFATMFWGVLDTETRILYYVNAGHEAPLHLKRDGSICRLPSTGTPVGMIGGVTYEVDLMQLEPDSLFFAYTDGVNEALSPAGTLFSEKRLLDLICAGWLNQPKDIKKLLNEVDNQIQVHVAEAEPSDDVTMLAVRWIAPD
jgi:serine phosphatase RsbU (regulator of sigma subunit)